MKLVVFKKSRRTQEGKPFATYLAKLRKRSGEEVTIEVKFKQDVPVPKEFPAIIQVSREDASLSEREHTMEDGRVFTSRQLWVSAWGSTGEVYVDHSLDDYED